jgi:glycosyltransferase involved in cell wall biosynthesis
MAPRPLTIGLVSTTYVPIAGGMESYLDHLSGALATDGHDVRVVTRYVEQRPDSFARLLQSAEPSREYIRNGVRVRVLAPRWGTLPFLKPTFWLHHHGLTESLAILLYRAAYYGPLATALADCDVVHYSGTGRELIGFVAQEVATDAGLPFFVTPHTHVGSWGDSAIDFRLYQKADGLIALTDYERSIYVEAGLDPNRIWVQGHGVNVTGTGDGASFRREIGIGDAPFILFLGRKSACKGYPLLLQAAPEVWARHPEARFVLAGPNDPSLSLLPETARVLEDARVMDLGYVSDQTREDLYAACDLFCLPSSAEAFGLVYLEAGFYDKPVVALDIPTLRELIARRETGLVTDATREGVAHAISSLLNNPALRNRLGKNGSRFSQSQRWEDVAQRMSTLYRGVRNGARF